MEKLKNPKPLLSLMALAFIAALGFPLSAIGQGTADYLAKWRNPDPLCQNDVVCMGLGTPKIYWGTPIPGSFASKVEFQGSTFGFPFPFTPNPIVFGEFEFCNGTIIFGTGIDSAEFRNEVSGTLFGVAFTKFFGDRLLIENTPNIGTPEENADIVYWENVPEKIEFRVKEEKCGKVQLKTRLRGTGPIATFYDAFSPLRLVVNELPDFEFEFAGFGEVLTPDTAFLSLRVPIDIKPGSMTNAINTRSRGVVPVALLGSETLDVTQVNVATLTFGPNKAFPSHHLSASSVFEDHLQDVNSDGVPDLISHYRTFNTGIESGETSACLLGETYDGTPFKGCDSITTVRGSEHQ